KSKIALSKVVNLKEIGVGQTFEYKYVAKIKSKCNKGGR
ncbi:unnamed protein product, partial [marine sediment metagenome]